MANSNAALNKGKKEKEDEFYTQLSDIENEMRHYKKYFKGKTVFCNCDDPFESNFFKFFVLNFNRLGLKKLICTCYSNSPIAGTQLSFADIGKEYIGSDRAYKAIVTEVYDATGNGGIDMLDIAELFRLGKNNIEELQGDGDFRSSECLALLDEADIVVTNPPFSLFREFIQTLVEKNKKFIVLGRQTSIKYKEIFPLFMKGQLWLGYNNGEMAFRVPEYFEERNTRFWVDDNGNKWRSFGNISWYTNLDVKKRHEELILVKKYSSELYPKYVNFDAIHVDRVSNTPCDYEGYMSVPITFLINYNPEQFELIGTNSIVLKDAVLSDDIRANHSVARRLNFYLPFPDGNGNNYTRMFDRLIIRNKHPEQPKGK